MNKLQWNLNLNSNIFIQENVFGNVWKTAAFRLGLNVLISHSGLLLLWSAYNNALQPMIISHQHTIQLWLYVCMRVNSRRCWKICCLPVCVSLVSRFCICFPGSTSHCDLWRPITFMDSTTKETRTYTFPKVYKRKVSVVILLISWYAIHPRNYVHDLHFVLLWLSTCQFNPYPAGITLGMGSANKRRRYNVTSYLIGWAHTQLSQ